MSRFRIAVACIAVLGVFLVLAPRGEASKTPTITRSIGTVLVGTGGTFTVDASNFTGKSRSVTVELKGPVGFTVSPTLTSTITTGHGASFNFNCPSGAYCGAIVIAKSVSKIILDAHWTYNGVEYFVRPGEWVKA